jgi:signal transduction histidine kinase
MARLRGLRPQILFWAILPLILILILVSFGSINLHQHSMREMVAERDAQIASLAASQLDGSLEQRTLALRTLLEESANGTASLADGSRPLLADFDGGVILRMSDGRTTPLTTTSATGLKTEAEAIFAQALGRRDTAVYSFSLASDPAGAILIAVSDPNTGAAAVGQVSAQRLGLSTIVQQIGSQGHAAVMLIGQDGRVLFDRGSQEVGLDLRGHAGVPESLAGHSGSTFTHFPGQPEHVVGYAPLATTGWGLIVVEPWEDVIMPVLQYTLLAPLIVLAAAVASLLAVYFGLRRIVRPLQELGRKSSRLAWGDFEAITRPVDGIDEIRELQRTLQEMAGQIRRSQVAMQDYIAALTETQEDERKRLARDLHDETVQSLIALSQRITMLRLDLADAASNPDPGTSLVQAEQRIDELASMLTHTLTEVRGMIRNLRPIYLEELGLVAAIEMLVDGARKNGLDAAFEVKGEECRLAPEVEMAAYRIAQEGLSNVTRHSSASSVAVTLEYVEEGVTLTVEDDGAGFQPPDMPSDLASQGHFGLLGMYERSTRLGGHFSVRSTPGTGTRIIAYLPG